jgi:hypothetical protein
MYPLAIRYWATWSRIYRFFTRIRGLTVMSGLPPTRVQLLLSTLPWAPDRWTDLFDVAADPTKFQRALDEKIVSGVVLDESRDCDDFAGWAAYSMDPAYRPEIVTIAYQRINGASVSGHVVCAFRLPDTEGGLYFHIGNWGLRGPYSCLELVAHGVAHEASAKLVGYALLTKDLSVQQVVRV